MKYKSFLQITAETFSDTVRFVQEPESWLWSFSMAGLFQFIVTYVYADFQFLIFLAIAIFANTFSKIWVIIRDKPQEFSLAVLFGKLVDKVIKYSIGLVCIHVLVHFTVNGEKNQFFDFITHFFYGIFMVSEVRPTLERLGIALPPQVTDTLNNFLKKKTS